MKISYNWLSTYFEEKLPKPADLAETINAHVFEIESIEKIGDDTVMDVKVMPDRAHYALCHQGIAREVRVITGLKMATSSVSFVAMNPVAVTSSKKVAVKVDNRDLCSRYVARLIENVSITSSPRNLMDRLDAVGSRPISSIVDATNYVMLDIGQPLHAFDADKVIGGITVRKAKKGEKIELLPERVLVESNGDGTRNWVEKERILELSDSDLIIADDVGPIAIAGVKGGRRAEISTTTKNIILESANFDPVAIRRTSTRLNIRNDSSKRFENEIIPELAENAMNKVTSLILDMSPKALVSEVTDIWNRKTLVKNITVSSDFISSKLGSKITTVEIGEILKREECRVEINGSVLSIAPSLDRLDPTIPEDFVDEIARIKGYENVQSVLPPDLKEVTLMDKSFYWSEMIKNILVGQGFSETLLYSLVPKGHYEIAYPLASDKAALRESIVPRMKEILITNALNADLLSLDVIKVFEIGRVFPKTGEKTVLCMGVKNVKKSKIKEVDIIRDIISNIENVTGAKIAVDIKENIIEIDLDVFFAKISATGSVNDLDIKFLPKDKKYQPFSLYPFIVRDIAVFVTGVESADQVWSVIEKGIEAVGASKLLVRSSLFDTFKKDGKTSYAFRMVFQSFDRTLTDEEASKIMDKVYVEIKKNKWEVR